MPATPLDNINSCAGMIRSYVARHIFDGPAAVCRTPRRRGDGSCLPAAPGAPMSLDLPAGVAIEFVLVGGPSGSDLGYASFSDAPEREVVAGERVERDELLEALHRQISAYTCVALCDSVLDRRLRGPPAPDVTRTAPGRLATRCQMDDGWQLPPRP